MAVLFPQWGLIHWLPIGVVFSMEITFSSALNKYIIISEINCQDHF
ncbi:hypothetical protein NHE_0123 [Neorickettsia helminthoeca str. Oregon]|uniref:Uncharacterized protein n=1 Tax=Neorickettsia helminthoeca str. Oregon TaxID=1286528 RepID=X5H334_9RICK|nr:hypothetical protein NHE_0123 [Neorickettsia helminthoeca str. Oregon]